MRAVNWVRVGPTRWVRVTVRLRPFVGPVLETTARLNPSEARRLREWWEQQR